MSGLTCADCQLSGVGLQRVGDDELVCLPCLVAMRKEWKVMQAGVVLGARLVKTGTCINCNTAAAVSVCDTRYCAAHFRALIEHMASRPNEGSRRNAERLLAWFGAEHFCPAVEEKATVITDDTEGRRGPQGVVDAGGFESGIYAQSPEMTCADCGGKNPVLLKIGPKDAADHVCPSCVNLMRARYRGRKVLPDGLVKTGDRRQGSTIAGGPANSQPDIRPASDEDARELTRAIQGAGLMRGGCLAEMLRGYDANRAEVMASSVRAGVGMLVKPFDDLVLALRAEISSGDRKPVEPQSPRSEGAENAEKVKTI